MRSGREIMESEESRILIEVIACVKLESGSKQDEESKSESEDERVREC